MTVNNAGQCRTKNLRLLLVMVTRAFVELLIANASYVLVRNGEVHHSTDHANQLVKTTSHDCCFILPSSQMTNDRSVLRGELEYVICRAFNSNPRNQLTPILAADERRKPIPLKPKTRMTTPRQIKDRHIRIWR